MENGIKKELLLNGINSQYSDEEKVRAAYALNMCMVSVSQIIDYNDIYVLEQEYEAILNNLNLEMMPKDESLLKIIKQVLDTITFFRIQEGDKVFIDKAYQQKMKNAIWSAIPNFGLIVAGGNPVSMAVSLASQVGIGYMNYRRAKADNKLDYEKEMWQLQRSAMEQFNGLRRELFDTAWRLADTYRFPDEYRLTERQIKQYDEILMDSDEVRKYERLTTIKDKFIAYPPFWYHYGNTANYIARDYSLTLSDKTREGYKKLALEHFEQYWNSNKYALLREDQIAASCALEEIDLLDAQKDREKIENLLNKAVEFSGDSKDILQLCAIAYLKIDKKDKAANIFRILINEEYNMVVNAQVLSGIYVNMALDGSDVRARDKYEILANRVNNDYLFRMPAIEENINADELKDEFAQKQEDNLKTKFNVAIRYYFNEFGIALGRLIPVPDPDKTYSEDYFLSSSLYKRIQDTKDLFGSSFKQKKRADYLTRLSQCGFVNAYFDTLNSFFGEISEINCVRDRQKLQDIISNKIVENAQTINQINRKVEDAKATMDDVCSLLGLTSINMYEDFINELLNQIDVSIMGMNEMSQYANADSSLREFCVDHNIPEPDILINEGKDAESDSSEVNTYFSFDLLGQEGSVLINNQSRYRKIEKIIREHSSTIDAISEKSVVYFHDSAEFNAYFENSSLRNHRDILQKTIAVYDDKAFKNVDVLFTSEGVVPVIRNKIKSTIPYISLASEDTKNRLLEIIKVISKKDKRNEIIMWSSMKAVPGLTSLVLGALTVDTYSINDIVKKTQNMIDEICEVIVEDIGE